MKNVNMVSTRDMDFENVLQSIMPMIRSIARQADGVCGLEMEDVEQELSIQAYRSWETWEPERGSKFSTYVYETLVKQKNCLIRTAKAGMEKNAACTTSYLTQARTRRSRYSRGRFGKLLRGRLMGCKRREEGWLLRCWKDRHSWKSAVLLAFLSLLSVIT